MCFLRLIIFCFAHSGMECTLVLHFRNGDRQKKLYLDLQTALITVIKKHCRFRSCKHVLKIHRRKDAVWTAFFLEKALICAASKINCTARHTRYTRFSAGNRVHSTSRLGPCLT